MEYQLSSQNEDLFQLNLGYVADAAKAAFETLLWSEGVRDDEEVDGSVVTGILVGVADFVNNPTVAAIIEMAGLPAEFVGHNLILSGNRHGTGFWDNVGRGGENATDEQLRMLHDYSSSFEIYQNDDEAWYMF